MVSKISIIIPVYNVESYLRKCLDSIINQIHRNLEIIIINDGSTDKSGEICDEYALKDSRIKVLHQNNRGVSAARNLGLEISEGEYIGFVDSDDWIEKDMYSFLVQIAEQNNADVAVCGYYINNFNPYLDSVCIPQCIDQEAAIKMSLDLEYFSLGAGLCNKIFKRDMIRKNSIELDEAISIGEDMLYLCQCIMYSKKIIYSNDPKYHYIINETSATQKPFHSEKISVLEAHNKIEKMVKVQYPKLISIIHQRSAVNSYNLLRLAMNNMSFCDVSIIRLLQNDIKREFIYALIYSKLPLVHKAILPLITISPITYRYLRLFYKKRSI